MELQIESYEKQKERWPGSGKHIMAQFDDESIFVYQSYRPFTLAFLSAGLYGLSQFLIYGFECDFFSIDPNDDSLINIFLSPKAQSYLLLAGIIFASFFGFIFLYHLLMGYRIDKKRDFQYYNYQRTPEIEQIEKDIKENYPLPYKRYKLLLFTLLPFIASTVLFLCIIFGDLEKEFKPHESVMALVLGIIMQILVVLGMYTFIKSSKNPPRFAFTNQYFILPPVLPFLSERVFNLKHITEVDFINEDKYTFLQFKHKGKKIVWESDFVDITYLIRVYERLKFYQRIANDAKFIQLG